MMGKFQRMSFRDKLSVHEITKRTGLARDTTTQVGQGTGGPVICFIGKTQRVESGYFAKIRKSFSAFP
jgi:hypothetical protein